MLHRLLYVSYSTLYMPNDEEIVESIVQQAYQRNPTLGLTGALIFTHQRFAQYLEGPEAGIAELMASIRRDSRHRDIEIAMSAKGHFRLFPSWAMVYAGPSDVIAAQVDALVSRQSDVREPGNPERLVRLMRSLATREVRFPPVADIHEASAYRTTARGSKVPARSAQAAMI